MRAPEGGFSIVEALVATSDIGNGNKVFKYHSCNIRKAANAFGSLVEEPGAWFERM